jgi:hypothetical protein
VPFGLSSPPAAAAAGAALPSRYHAVGDEVPLGRFVRTLLRQLVQELLKSGPEFAPRTGRRPGRLHPAQLVELPLPRPHRRCSHPGHLLVQIHRGLNPPLLHSGHLRTIVIGVAAIRARAYALQLIQGAVPICRSQIDPGSLLLLQLGKVVGR